MGHFCENDFCENDFCGNDFCEDDFCENDFCDDDPLSGTCEKGKRERYNHATGKDKFLKPVILRIRI